MSKWKVFNRQGKYLKTVTEKDTAKLEERLRQDGVYAHRVESFQSRPERWQQLSFKEKLETLGWEFRNGVLVNTDW
ncbi:hypothetical protein [Anaeromusa acidaminophila]|uniref:hypothetical protein n=1 Tax=Anaeromusa acidaminophila TaxID=81464 RepID=UPI0012E9A60F|nr:hypothetical protein [Anaeromusa acidaminophila]